MSLELVAPEAGDLAGLIDLNTAHAVETGPLTLEQLRTLIGAAFRCRIVRPALALCLAFDQSADYLSPNFLWFRERYPRFVYVDRVIVAEAARGQGLARALYADLIAAAQAAGHDRLVCEVNADPPNPASAAFHAGLGFAEVGRARLANGKTVAYLRHWVSGTLVPDTGSTRSPSASA